MTTAGSVPPDTKDWTWVLERPCPECGLEAGSVYPGDLPHLLRANAQVWLALMGHPEVAVRPEPHVWSPLEYACHVHDVHQLFHERVTAMLTEDQPALRQLGPGHHGRREEVRRAGAGHRGADAGRRGVRRR